MVELGPRLTRELLEKYHNASAPYFDPSEADEDGVSPVSPDETVHRSDCSEV